MKSAQRLVAALAILLVSNTLAFAQGGGSRSTLSGRVVDDQGAAIPGVAILITDENSGNTFESVTSAQGLFSIPALPAGTYTVTATLSGFKKAVLKGNKLLSAQPLDVQLRLEVGGLEETITVEGGAPLIQTQSAAISSTVQADQIMTIPVATRSAIDFMALQPGIQTPAGTRDSMISGLDQSAINITVDGMSVQDNYLKTTDGFFARLSPRLDMVEEVVLTTAAGSADVSGQGAAQITFTTRRGTNTYSGSIYEYYRRDKLNANSWFNNRNGIAKAPLKFDTPGFRLGGPIRIPGLYDGRNKAHFFINYEEQRQPSAISRDRTMLTAQAVSGIFRYQTAAGIQSVNLLQLAAANGQTSTMDPVISRLLQDIRSAASSGGTITALADPNIERLSFQAPTDSVVKYPTVRLDFQVTPKHLVTLSGTMNNLLSTPDTLNNRDAVFPGFPVQGVQDSKRFVTSATLRSTLTPNFINELRIFGASGGATLFSTEINPSMWSGSVANMAGFHLNINGACCTGGALANPASGPAISSREASTKVIYDRATWVRGQHTWSFGVDFTQVDVWLENQTNVPQINFGVATGDPAAAMFTTANFPGASAANLTAARGLYSILTGRVQAIVGNARLDPSSDEYKYLGKSRAEGRMREFDFFVHDTWKIRPNMTLNYGLRYALQMPLYPLNNSYATATLADIYGVSGEGNLFRPGIAGSAPRFVQYEKGKGANETDLNNFAPSFGITWRPNISGGFLRTLLTDEPVLRAGFSMAYSRNGMSDFTDTYGANPGILIDASRDQTQGNLGAVPLLFRDQSRLGPPSFQARPAFPLADVISGDIRIFDPNLKVPYSQTWSASLQRSLGDKMAMDVRYVGSRGRDLWNQLNYNEANIFDNGFLQEFRLAQQNLQANIRAGRGNTFAYFGAGTGTSPLPIYLAYLNGVGAALAGDAARYTGASWSDTNFTNPLALFNPTPFTPAGTNANTGLDGSATRRANARAAGLPANFFRANPDLLGGAFVRTNDGSTSFHSVEVALARRMSRGLWFNGSYSFGKSWLSQRYTLREDPKSALNTGTEGMVLHSAKFFGGWQLPFGKGRRFASNAPGLVDAIIGGWQLTGTARFQSGRMLDFGNVRLVGMSKSDLQKAFKLRFDDAGRQIWMLPQDIIDNTIKAFSTQATSLTGYGALGAPSGRYMAPANGPDCISPTDPAIYGTNFGFGGCGEGQLEVTGPMYKTVDIGIEKTFKVRGRVSAVFRAELLNAFNWANFAPVATASNAITAYEVTGLADGPRIAQLVLRVNF